VALSIPHVRHAQLPFPSSGRHNEPIYPRHEIALDGLPTLVVNYDSSEDVIWLASVVKA
jgi:hypothetical protein